MAHPCIRALVVDDDEGVREVIADSLRLEEIEVVSARGAAEAISALDAGCRPSIILLDLLMPGVSGERLLPVLRQHPGAQGVPIVAMSASPERLARMDGADARLPKPFDLGVLLATMERLCAGEGDAVVLGIPSIDSEHRRLVELAAAIAEPRGGDEALPAADLLDELIDRTRDHFSNEDGLMRRHGYPGSAAHVDEHARHVAELERWREASVHGTAPWVVRRAPALRATIESHIATLDRDLARFLVARGFAA